MEPLSPKLNAPLALALALATRFQEVRSRTDTARLLGEVTDVVRSVVEAEALEVAGGGEGAAAEVPGGLAGKRVEVHGTSRADMNGQRGMATSFDEAAGRYVVRLDGPTGKTVKLKPTNVRHDDRPPPPAQHTASAGGLGALGLGDLDPRLAQMMMQVQAIQAAPDAKVGAMRTQS